MGRAELGRILKPSPFLFCKAQPSPAHVCLSPSRPVSGLLNTSTHEGALQSTTKTNLVLSLTKSSRSYLIALIFWEISIARAIGLEREKKVHTSLLNLFPCEKCFREAIVAISSNKSSAWYTALASLSSQSRIVGLSARLSPQHPRAHCLWYS